MAEDLQASVVDLYQTGGLTERAIATRLRIPRRRVAELLAAAGIKRRTNVVACPLSVADRQAVYASGGNQAALARRYGVSPATARRWYAEAGIGEPDPDIDQDELRHLYIDEQYTTRELGQHYKCTSHWIITQLALAGIERRPRHQRRPRGPRAELIDDTLRRAYVEQGQSIEAICQQWGVGQGWLSEQLRRLGITKRPGTFTADPDTEAELAATVAAAYNSDDQLTIADVATQFDIGATRARYLLHRHGADIRPPGPRSEQRPGRNILADLHADPQIKQVINDHDLPIRDPNHWRPLDPFAPPVELTPAVLQALYGDIGLTLFQIHLLTGLGATLIKARINDYGIQLRTPGKPAPWTRRTYVTK